MFKHMLIPTDGSRVAAKAVKAGIGIAQQLGARVTGYCAIEQIRPRTVGDGYMIDRKLVQVLERRAAAAAQKYVEAIGKVAKAAGVEFEPCVSKARTPYEGIIDAAKKKKCDAIFMASHGRRGLAGLLMGSVTHKVLTRTRIPVLVYR